MFKLKSILLSVLLLAGFTAFAQQITVTGVVTSSTDGYGVIGAAVMEKGTTNGTTTDFDGNFTLTEPSWSSPLSVTPRWNSPPRRRCLW